MELDSAAKWAVLVSITQCERLDQIRSSIIKGLVATIWTAPARIFHVLFGNYLHHPAGGARLSVMSFSNTKTNPNTQQNTRLCILEATPAVPNTQIHKIHATKPLSFCELLSVGYVYFVYLCTGLVPRAFQNTQACIGMCIRIR